MYFDGEVESSRLCRAIPGDGKLKARGLRYSKTNIEGEPQLSIHLLTPWWAVSVLVSSEFGVKVHLRNTHTEHK